SFLRSAATNAATQSFSWAPGEHGYSLRKNSIRGGRVEKSRSVCGTHRGLVLQAGKLGAVAEPSTPDCDDQPGTIREKPQPRRGMGQSEYTSRSRPMTKGPEYPEAISFWSTSGEEWNLPVVRTAGCSPEGTTLGPQAIQA